MKVVQINATCGIGSTGRIAESISEILTQNNIENYVFYTNSTDGYELGVKYTSMLDIKLSAGLSRVFANYGFNSHRDTKRLIKKIEDINPDIIQLHNIHGHGINLEMFFSYLKEKNKRVIWTMHDCWAFTGYCTHFIGARCEKWKHECGSCPLYRNYSYFFDNSKKNFLRKKKAIGRLENMTIVTPCKWMADLIKYSYAKKFPVKIINNGINLDIFRPIENNIREKYNIGNKKIILGQPKGRFSYFNELAECIDNDKYALVLAGLKKDDFNKIAKNAIGIEWSPNPEFLAKIYTASDVFVNFTMEDTFPTVNIESLACGTPVVTFKTGGSPEIIDEETGIVIEQRDIKGAYEAIERICDGEDRTKACIKRANDLYNARDRFMDYIDLYTQKGRFSNE